jgi:hypothetical protein
MKIYKIFALTGMIYLQASENVSLSREKASKLVIKPETTYKDFWRKLQKEKCYTFEDEQLDALAGIFWQGIRSNWYGKTYVCKYWVLSQKCDRLPDQWVLPLINDLAKKDGFLEVNDFVQLRVSTLSSYRIIEESEIDEMLKDVAGKSFESAGVRGFYQLLCSQKQLFLCNKSNSKKNK